LVFDKVTEMDNYKIKNISFLAAIGLTSWILCQSIGLFSLDKGRSFAISLPENFISDDAGSNYYILSVEYIITGDIDRMTKDTSRNKTDSDSSENMLGQRVLIQIQSPDKKLDMASVQNLLKDTGIDVDVNYGPYLVNPQKGNYVVRGTATLEAQEKSKQISGVTIFSDSGVGPITK
jgi:hypothetical protein